MKNIKVLHVELLDGTKDEVTEIGNAMQRLFDKNPELKKDYVYLVTNDISQLSSVGLDELIERLQKLKRE